MNADKRSVTTDAMDTLDMLITSQEKRDAIHLAVDNVVAAHTLRPGEDVGFLGDGSVGICDDPVGIVDPFLKVSVKKGERFWLVVYPRTITSLRHVWTHPAFAEAAGEVSAAVPTVAANSRSRDWIEEFAIGLGVSYEEIIRHAGDYLEYGERWSEGDRFESEHVPDEFWIHYELVTGTRVGDTQRGSFFSCSC